MDLGNIGSEKYADNENGYDGLGDPVQIEDIDDFNGPAVVVGTLRQDVHLVTAGSHGVLVVQHVPDSGR